MEFNVAEEKKVNEESDEEERKDWSKIPLPPTPKKKPHFSACELNV